MPPMTPAESDEYRPYIEGWSTDILPWYRRVAAELPDGAAVVEVGVYYGRSLLFLAEELYTQGKTRCRLYGIDPCEWREGQWETLKRNQLSIGPAAGMVRVVRIPSIEAATEFADRSLDLVFIDAEHDYTNVKRDIEAWTSKVKPNGLLAGHDYNEGAHPGVVQAVRECVDVFTTYDHNDVWESRR